jgi:L-ascorbate metabolism protein UlaG (beta-lactamase superfamily)
MPRLWVNALDRSKKFVFFVRFVVKSILSERIWCLPLAGILFSCAAAPPPEFSEAEWYARTKEPDISLLYAPHTNPNGSFFNPWMPRPERSAGRWRKSSGEEFVFPAEQYAFRENDYAYLKDKTNNSISFVGHASTIIKMDGETVFTDPFLSNAALIVGKKVKIPFDFEKVPERPVVLISHNHYDHLDTYSVKRLIKKKAVFVVPLGLKRFFTGKGAKEVFELDWWESARVGAVTYTLLPAQHWSRRIEHSSNQTLWGSFLIQGSKTVYFSGDTGYFRGFEEYGRRYDIDYALLGAGAYEPRWFMHYSHMNVKEFFLAAEELRAGTAIPVHFGVISLSDEPILYPLYEVEKYLEERPELAQRIRPLRVGEHIEW